MIKLVIAGRRDFNDYELMEKKIKERYELTQLEIVSGCANGADKLGEKFAKENNIPLTTFPANWSLGKRSGMIRNEEMANYADEAILFLDGYSSGTSNMIHTKRNKMKKITVIRY